MFDIIILAIGKIREDYFAEAAGEYLKRLKPYARIEMVELEPAPFNSSNKEKAKRLEAEKILNYLEKYSDSQIFILHERGKSFDSQDFAKTLEGVNRRTIFVVGGSLGFDGSILGKNWPKLSLSPLTFPHEMARVVLLEQIYRAATIVKGKDYHY